MTFGEIYNKYSQHTMIPWGAYETNLELASRKASNPGCVVECGVWKGGMIAGIAEVLGPDRHYALFDSFEGLPPAKEIDGVFAKQWQEDTSNPGYYNNCSAEMHFAVEAMNMSKAKKVSITKGWFDKTLPFWVPSEKIALLRIDGDWYDSTMTCLQYLIPHLSHDGLVILDDYYRWEGCSKAVHDYLSKTESSFRISQLNGVAVLLQRV